MEKYGGKKKGRVSTATFQKKLVVFEYMGPDAPNVFTRTDKKICMRGLLPAIPLNASETEVRNEICDVVRTCSFPDLTECPPIDFEFIDMSGKQARVPQCKAGFEWGSRAIKELAGSGCVYIRLIQDVGDISGASSSDDFPEFSVARDSSSSFKSSATGESTDAFTPNSGASTSHSGASTSHRDALTPHSGTSTSHSGASTSPIS